MRIALLAPLVSPIAPPFLGGAQSLVADLATGMLQRGHAVTLYAMPGSDVPGIPLVPLAVNPDDLRPANFDAEQASAGGTPPADPEELPASRAFRAVYATIARSAAAHDVLHAHAYDWGAYAYGATQPLPIVHTVHLPPLDPAINALLGRLAPLDGAPASARLVTVSHAAAARYAAICRISAVIPNGVDVDRIPFGARPADPPYLLYAGRITPEKGVADALAIAERAGRPLLLAGGIYDEAYYRERIAPRIAASAHDAATRITYLGPLPHERLWELMTGAEAVLMPSHWEEPFGLVAAEAMAAGAPVIAYARGGLGEVIADGETGWIVPLGDIEGAATAVRRVRELDRRACRARTKHYFSVQAMLGSYEALYAQMAHDAEG